MSSETNGETDELKAVEAAESVIADPDSTEDEKAEAKTVIETAENAESKKKEETDEEEAHKKRVWTGMIESEVTKIALRDDYSIDNLPLGKLREAVEKHLKDKLSPKVSQQTDEDKLVQRAVEETKTQILLDQAKSLLPEEHGEPFVSEYEELKTKGYTATEALDKAKRIYQVPTAEDKRRSDDLNSMRAVKGGSVSPNRVSGAYDPVEHEKFNAQQKKMGLSAVSKEAFLKVNN